MRPIRFTVKMLQFWQCMAAELYIGVRPHVVRLWRKATAR